MVNSEMDVCAYCVEVRKTDQVGYVGCAYLHRIPKVIFPREMQKVISDDISMGNMFSVFPWYNEKEPPLRFEYSVLFPFDSTCPCFRPINLLKYEDMIEEWVTTEMAKEEYSWNR